MVFENEKRSLISAEEEEKISRSVLVWVNNFPELPVMLLNYEHLEADVESMALSTVQGTYIIKKYLYGGYQAQYDFKLIYRVKPAASNDKRLKADEILNSFGDWLMKHPLELSNGMRVVSVEPTTRSSLFAVYENGDEDHQIFMRLIYEVI